jgi:hypothetical protein
MGGSKTQVRGFVKKMQTHNTFCGTHLKMVAGYPPILATDLIRVYEKTLEVQLPSFLQQLRFVVVF